MCSAFDDNYSPPSEEHKPKQCFTRKILLTFNNLKSHFSNIQMARLHHMSHQPKPEFTPALGAELFRGVIGV
jgi:hypothetical protein